MSNGNGFSKREVEAREMVRAKLRAENTRLRNALQRVVDELDPGICDEYGSVDMAKRIAMEALE